MSYILDALKKAEQDRSRGQVPDIKRVIRESRDDSQRKRSWVFGVIAVNLILVAAVVWILKGQIPWPGQSTGIPEPATASRPAPAAGQVVTDIDEAVSPVQSTVKRADRDGNADQPELTQAGQRKLAAAKQPARPASVTVTEFRNMPTEPASPAIPLPLSEMPVEFRRSLPELELNAHFFSDRPQRRFVLVNMQRYSEQESLPGGVTVQEITPEGVIMSYRGQRFLLPR